MAKRICIQMGHINAQAHTIAGLKGNTGAPGEQELTKRIADRLASLLRDRGFEVKQTDAVAYNDPLVTKVDWDLFLTLHGDANVYNTGGGFIDRPEFDGAAAESRRILEAIESEYFKHSEIVNHPERRNVNTRRYYMWQYLTLKTPCNILEMGVVQDARDKVLLTDTARIANAIARGICKAFGVAFDIPTAPDPLPTDPKDKQIEQLKAQVEELKQSLSSTKEEHSTKLANIREECYLKIDEFELLTRQKIQELKTVLEKLK